MADEQKPAPAAPGAKKKEVSRISSAKKRELQSERRNANNRSFKAKVSTAIRAFEAAISKGDKGVMKEKLNMIFSLMDKGVKTNKFKSNKASRTKARLTKRLPA